MGETDVALLIMSLGVLVVFAGLFIWGIFTGQFRNVEEPKYRMLNLENPLSNNPGKDGDANA
jgi:hypothetical protein